jgi:threonine/homoserine/homoserine lactone efflux protein
LTQPDARQNLFKATVVNLLNPYPYLSWSLVMGPLLMSSWREAPANGISLVAGFYSAMILTVIGIILLFSLVSKTGARINRILKGVSALVLACFGLFQLWLGISALCLD